jgi:protoporphyrinogen oxidase
VIGMSYMKWHFWPYPQEENLEEWVTNRFGRQLYQIFFKTYTEKVWGIPCTEIRSEWAAQRIKGLSLARAILAAATITKRPTKIKSLIEEFQYPRLGPGQMWETCADKIRAMGHPVLLHHRVSALEHENGRVVAVRVQSPEGEKRIPCDHVISSMPLRTLIQSFDPQPDPPIMAAANGLNYRDFLTVALVLDQRDVFPDNWIYIHTPGVKVGRVQNFRNWSAAMIPDDDKTCLGLEYFCFEGDGLWNSPDEDLVALGTRELAELGLAGDAKVVDGAVVRMPKAYPTYDHAYQGHVDTIRSFIDPIPNLHTVGRNGMHKYNNQDHSMLTAAMSVWNMQGASHDIWTVNTDYEYHEEQRLKPEAKPAGASPTAAAAAASD